jgi:putative transposase
MSRVARVDISGYHYIYNAGLKELKVFKEDEYKEEFLKIVCDTCKRYRASLHAFFIGDGYYKILLKTTSENLSLIMRQINSSYSRSYNSKKNRTGHIWQDRFKSWYIDDERLLTTIFRYIDHHKKQEAYQYHASHYINHGIYLPCLKSTFILKLYGFEKFQQLMAVPFTSHERRDIEKFKRDRYFLKDDQVTKKRNIPLENYFVDIKSKLERNEEILRAFYAGYTQSEIARHLMISQPTVSLVINKKSTIKSDNSRREKTNTDIKEKLEDKYQNHFNELLKNLKKYKHL